MEIFSSWAFWSPLWISLKVAACATVLAAVVGVGLAWAQSRGPYPARDWLDALFTVPLVLPPTVLGYYLLVLMGHQSALGRWLEDSWGIRLVFSWQGAAVAATFVALPLVYKSARLGFESVPRQLEEAARGLGLRGLSVFWRVSLPLSWRHILAGCALAFARAMGEFGATLMVAGNIPGQTQTLASAVYEAVQVGNDTLATAWVAVVTISCLLMLVLAGRCLQAGACRRDLPASL